jgi:hypothetical protein
MLPHEKGYDSEMPAPAIIGMIGRVAGTRAAGQGVGAAAGAVTKGGEASQVMGLVQSVMGLADESKNLMRDIVGKPFADSAKKLQMGKSVVQNDANGLIQQLDVLPEGVKKFSQALKDLTGAVVDRGRELSGYNGNLAQSYAENDVKKLFADIRESNYLGKSYSAVNDKATDAETKFMDAMNPVKDALARILGEILDKINGVLDFMKEHIDIVVIMSEAAVATFQFISGNWQGAMDTINSVPEKIAKAQRNTDVNYDFINDIFRNAAKGDQSLVPRAQAGNAPFEFGFQ